MWYNGNMRDWEKTFYSGYEWRSCRAAYMRSVGYICERCADSATAARVVHHKRHLTPGNIGNPSVTLSWDNLEALCQDCHNTEHHRKSGRPESRYEFGSNGELIAPHN
ncbi:hypothetical protein FACS1894208_01330 [Clostridia bacterium]|nr:hypothetical protein FACS1894208_01330 [Clostridia bacterium]